MTWPLKDSPSGSDSPSKGLVFPGCRPCLLSGPEHNCWISSAVSSPPCCDCRQAWLERTFTALWSCPEPCGAARLPLPQPTLSSCAQNAARSTGVKMNHLPCRPQRCLHQADIFRALDERVTKWHFYVSSCWIDILQGHRGH